MILGFKEQFKEKILNKSKKHTIREDRNNRWKAGMMIQFATGVRTANYNQFYTDQCRRVQNISIVYDNIQPNGRTLSIYVDRYELTLNEIEILSTNDGFDSLDEFLDWFNKDFNGKIIHWTDLQY